MHATLNEFRDYLIQPQPNTEQPYNTYLYYPPNGTLVIDPDHVLLLRGDQWSMPTAIYY